MRSVGFGDTTDNNTIQKNVNNSSNIKSIVTLSALPPDFFKSKSTKLPVDLIETIKCRRQEIEVEVVALDGAPSVSAAVRDMRLHHTVSEVRTGVETVLSIVRNVLQDPKDMKLQKVKTSNAAFQRNLGRLNGSELLMNAIGFIREQTPRQGQGQGSGQGSGQGFEVQTDGGDISAYVLKSVIDDLSSDKGGYRKDSNYVLVLLSIYPVNDIYSIFLPLSIFIPFILLSIPFLKLFTPHVNDIFKPLLHAMSGHWTH